MTRRCAAVHLDATSKVASLECSTKLRSRSGTAGAGGAAVVAGGAKRGPQRPVPLAAPPGAQGRPGPSHARLSFQ